jgi:hypothetical protein
MTHSGTASRFPFRLIVWSIGLTLALLTSTVGVTAASTLIPMVDTGGSGGGGGAASATLDETDRALAPIATSDASDLPAFALTANARSIQLIESTYAPGGYLANWDDIEATAAEADVVTVQRTGVQPF